MKNKPVLKVTVLNPEQLAGSKWISISYFFGDKMSVEFIDKTNCIYKSEPKEYPMTYNVIGGKIYISKINGAFEIRDNMLYNNNLPAFRRAA